MSTEGSGKVGDRPTPPDLGQDRVSGDLPAEGGFGELVDITGVQAGQTRPGTSEGSADVINLCDYVADVGAGNPSTSVYRGEGLLAELRARCEQGETINLSAIRDPEAQAVLREWLDAWRDPEIQAEVAAGLKRSGLLS